MDHTVGYKIRNKAGIHFITFAVVEWVDVFTRDVYKNVLLDSIRHCQAQRDMVLYAWCLMTNHLHMIMSAEKNDTSEILRNFKKYTSKKIVQAIENNRQESRRAVAEDYGQPTAELRRCCQYIVFSIKYHWNQLFFSDSVQSLLEKVVYVNFLLIHGGKLV